jgi:hypothetical protein
MSSLQSKIQVFLFLAAFPVLTFSQEVPDSSSADTTQPIQDTIRQPRKSSPKTPEKEIKETSEEDAKTTSKKPKKNRSDTIYLFEKDPMFVNVMKITYDSVIYRDPGTIDLKKVDKDRVNKIKYNWGRIEILNETQPKIQKRYNWRKVKILESKNKTEDLFLLEKIQAKAEGSSRGFDTPKSLENRAKVILKKKAANINAKYVLITNKSVTIAFGEIPSATLTGIAYTDEKTDSEQ